MEKTRRAHGPRRLQLRRAERMGEDYNAKVFVAGFSQDTTKEKLKEVFSGYGRVKSVWLAKKPRIYAFVEMETPAKAREAILALHGSKIGGLKVKVEAETGKPQEKASKESAKVTTRAGQVKPEITITEPVVENWKLDLVKSFFSGTNQKVNTEEPRTLMDATVILKKMQRKNLV